MNATTNSLLVDAISKRHANSENFKECLSPAQIIAEYMLGIETINYGEDELIASTSLCTQCWNACCLTSYSTDSVMNGTCMCTSEEKNGVVVFH
ncbi:hypothetical protein GCM10017624_41640 [Azotobacter vinelandii]|nr:hypothetical protein GCM10017624_41640 [Azotobacter vinelandii]